MWGACEVLDNAWCRDPGALDILRSRQVDVETDDKFISFYPPDLTAPPGPGTWGMKGRFHEMPEPPNPVPAGKTLDDYANAAYKLHTDGSSRCLPHCPVTFVTEDKPQAKQIRKKLQKRADYKAQFGNPPVLTPRMVPSDSWVFNATQANAFECVPIPTSHVNTVCAPALYVCMDVSEVGAYTVHGGLAPDSSVREFM